MIKKGDPRVRVLPLVIVEILAIFLSFSLSFWSKRRDIAINQREEGDKSDLRGGIASVSVRRFSSRIVPDVLSRASVYTRAYVYIRDPRACPPP